MFFSPLEENFRYETGVKNPRRTCGLAPGILAGAIAVNNRGFGKGQFLIKLRDWASAFLSLGGGGFW